MKAYFDFMAGGVDKMVDKNSGRYLYRKRGVFYFSRHVPIDMRAHHGCSRIVFCLKTKSGDAAVKGSQALAQKLDDYWLSLRIQQAPIPSVQARVANSQKASIDVPCISDALAAYLALKGFNKGEVFTRTATRNVGYLIEEFGDRPIGEYSSSDAARFRDALFERGLSSNSVKRIFASVRSIVQLTITEANLADVYALSLKHKARYCFDDKHWYLWDNPCWKRDTQRQILISTKKFIRDAAKQAIDNGATGFARSLLMFLSAQKLENLEKLARSEVPIELTDFDIHPMQLCVGDGVVDLTTGTLKASDPSMHHSKVAGTAYNSNASCPRFIQFLDDIFPDDLELVRYVQKVAGYTLTGSTKEQCLFMLLGGGANGKSTLLNVLTKLMGDYAVNTAASTLMASNQNHLGDDLVRLAGARLITASETEHGQRFAETKIKELTGGDKVSARPLYGSWVEFVPIGKIWLTTNNRPEIRGSDDGITRKHRARSSDGTRP